MRQNNKLRNLNYKKKIYYNKLSWKIDEKLNNFNH